MALPPLMQTSDRVPQGSVLGPALFLVYINDLPNGLVNPTRLFADDTALYSEVAKGRDQVHLQDDVNRLAVWETKWDMKFHPDKCTMLRCTHSPTPLLHDYILHDHTLDTVETANLYLGVTLHNKLDWDHHVNIICAKANSALGFLRRNQKVSSPKIKERAYKAFVRPLLEYAATAWDPYELKHKTQIEKVQRRAARFVLNRFHNKSSVTGMLQSLGWESLERRRRTARLVAFYKLTNDNMCCKDLKAQLHHAVRRSRRTGNTQRYVQHSYTTRYRAESFLPRTIRERNALPQEVVDAETPGTFVSRVSRLPH